MKWIDFFHSQTIQKKKKVLEPKFLAGKLKKKGVEGLIKSWKERYFEQDEKEPHLLKYKKNKGDQDLGWFFKAKKIN